MSLLSQKETQSAAHLVSALWSLLMLRWSCRKSGCACRLSGSISVDERGRGGQLMYVCALTVSVHRVRVHWVRTGALTVWRVSHTPHRQQCSGGAAEKCHSHSRRHSPDWSSERSAGLQHQRSAAGIQGAFLFHHCLQEILHIRHLFTCHSDSWGWLIRKQHHISLCGSSCWLYSVVSFGRHQERIFNLVCDLHEACLTLSFSSTCCQELDYVLLGGLWQFFRHRSNESWDVRLCCFLAFFVEICSQCFSFDLFSPTSSFLVVQSMQHY